MTFEEYLEGAAKLWQDEPGWRSGQAYFNYLYDVKPDLARFIYQFAKDIDPFHNDDKVPAFLAFIEQAWSQW